MVLDRIRERLGNIDSDAIESRVSRAANRSRRAARRAAAESRQRAVAGARSVELGGVGGARADDDQREMLRRAEHAATAGPPVEATLEPASNLEHMDALAGGRRRADAPTMEEFVTGRRRSGRAEAPRDPLEFDDSLGVGIGGGGSKDDDDIYEWITGGER